MRKGSSVGLLVLLAALVIVLTVAARAWKQVGSEALEISPGAEHGGVGQVRVEQATGAQRVGSAGELGELPDLQETRQQTDAHAEQLEQTLREID